MPHKGQARKRTVPVNPVYNNAVATKLVNQIMLDGKEGIAQKIVHSTFERIREKTGKEPIEISEAVMDNAMPVLKVKAKRIGGATYQVPIEVKPERRRVLALRWLTSFSRTRDEETQEERPVAELMNVANNIGSAVKRKEGMHRMIEVNKVFAHYRF